MYILLFCLFFYLVLSKPNIVVILLDDVGYGDFDSHGYDVPNIVKLKSKSIEFTQALNSDSLCTPSRASFLTSKYPIRLGLAHDFYRVIYNPTSTGGLELRYKTIADMLKDNDYSTALVGKYNIGINKYDRNDGYYLPNNHGFDYYYGLPLGLNYMCDPLTLDWHGCFLYDNVFTFKKYNCQVIEQPVNITTINDRLLSRTLKYIKELPQPFFLNYWSLMAHTPLYPKNYNSYRGKYGDTMMELDYHIGQIFDNLPNNTYLFLFSDNGNYKEEFPDSGNSGGLKGSKGQVYEGGIRTRLYVYHQNLIPKRIHNTVSIMDIYPTIQDILSVKVDDNLDGQSFYNMMYEKNINNNTRFLVHYCGLTAIAVRYNEYKIYYAEQIWTNEETQSCGEQIIPTLPYGACLCESVNLRYLYPPKIYNMNIDIEEQFPLDSTTPENQELISKCNELLDEHKLSIIPVENQMILDINENNQPCCNFPSCDCIE